MIVNIVVCQVLNNNNWLNSLSFLLIVINNREPPGSLFFIPNSLHLVTNLLFKLISGMIVENTFKSNSSLKEGKCSMKKMLVLLASTLVLTACAQPNKEAKESTTSKTEQTSKASSSAKEEKGLKFVVAPQFEGKTSDVM